jgi:uncharacterized protein (TIGR03437 family)
MPKLGPLCVFFISGLPLLANPALIKLPLAFEENWGQAAADIRFLARTPLYSVSLLAAAVDVQSRAGRFRMRFAGSRRRVRLEALDPQPGKANYFVGRNPRDWHTGIPTFGRVLYKGLYHSVDLIFHTGPGNQLEYDFRIAPGGNPSTIRLAFDGAHGLRTDGDGNLVLTGTNGNWLQHRPRAFQGDKSVECKYKLLADGQVGFAVASYDVKKPLIIDPTISYATYLGSGDGIGSIAVDAAGNAYVAGSGGTEPGFTLVAKLNAAGTALLYSTLIGGMQGELYGGPGPDLTGTVGSSIAIDPAGNVYLTGETVTSDFPVTQNALRASLNGLLEDGFLVKLDPTGSKLLYATYLGGGQPASMAMYQSSDLYIAGATGSPGFPTLNALQPAFGGGVVVDCPTAPQAPPATCTDAFVMHWRPSDMTLLNSTFLGGSGDDSASAIATDLSGNLYITGGTNSLNFPVAAAMQPNLAAGTCGETIVGVSSTTYPCSDAFVAEISADGKRLIFSTYLGGTASDWGDGIAVDAMGQAFIVGITASSDFPLKHASLPAIGGVCSDPSNVYNCGETFIAKIAQGGTALVFSSYFGSTGSGIENGPVVLDASGDAYFAVSYTDTPPEFTLPVSPGMINPCAGAAEGLPAILAEVQPDGSLVYSTRFGGTTSDAIGSMALDATGNLYLAGYTQSADFPVTAGAYQPQLSGTFDGFVAKIVPTPPPNSGTVLAAACIVNAASYSNWSDYGGVSGSVAPGEIISIFGSGLGPAAGAVAVLDFAGRIPMSLAGVTLTFDGIPAPLLYAQANQINAIVPFEVAGKRQTVVGLQYFGTVATSATLLVAQSATGIFTAGGPGTQIAALNQDGTSNSPANPAARGSIVSMWATGMGLLTQSYADGQIVTGPLGTPVNPPPITMDGLPLETQYLGQAPSLVAGAIQINLVVPATAASGPHTIFIGSPFPIVSGTIAVQ